MKQFLTFLLFLSSMGLSAQTIFVKSNAVGANNGTSWANAYTSLEAALAVAATGQSVWVAAGTYKPAAAAPNNSFFLSSGINLYGGFVGTETSIGQRNITANPTILSGDILGNDIVNNFTTNRTDNSQHVLIAFVLTDNLGMVIDGFTIRGGQTLTGTTNTDLTRRGGGLLINAKATVRNCTFTQNFGESGAGIAALDALSDDITVDNCQFIANEATEDAIFFLRNTPTGVIKNCTFRNNKTNRGALYPANSTNMLIDSCLFERNLGVNYGAGMFTWQSTFTLSNTTFLKNKAANAAGIYIDNRNGGDIATLENCVFEADSTTDYGGTAIFTYFVNLVADNCTFKNNVAPSSGAAFYNGDGSKFLVKNSLIEANKGNYAAAVANYGEGCIGTFENCTFKNNFATSGGGAVSNGFKADVKYKDCDFLNNKANFGGAIFTQNDSTRLEVEGCYFFENQADGTSGTAGCILVNSNIAASITTTTFFQNGGVTGGAISAIGDSMITINKCQFLENIATTQAAAVNLNRANAVITNSLFAKNIITGSGAGAAISNNAAADETSTLLAINCTFVDNIGPLGAGIAQWEDPASTTATSKLTLLNCLFQNPDYDNYAIEDGAPEVFSLGGNQSSDQTLALYLLGSKDLHGTTNTFQDESTNNYAHTLGSPASDGGVSAGAPADDILGVSRAGIPDVGYREVKTSGVSTLGKAVAALECAPNPATEVTVLSLENERMGQLNISIWNQAGQVVKQFSASKTEKVFVHSLNVSDLPAGNYKVQVNIGALRHGGAFVKI